MYYEQNNKRTLTEKELENIYKLLNERKEVWLGYYSQDFVPLKFINRTICAFEHDVYLMLGGMPSEEKQNIMKNFVKDIAKVEANKKNNIRYNAEHIDELIQNNFVVVLNRADELLNLYKAKDISYQDSINLKKYYSLELFFLIENRDTRDKFFNRFKTQLEEIMSAKKEEVENFYKDENNLKEIKTNKTDDSKKENFDTIYNSFNFYKNKSKIIDYLKQRKMEICALYAQETVPLKYKTNLLESFNMEMALCATEDFKNEPDLEKLERQLSLELENISELKKDGKEIQLNLLAKQILQNKDEYLAKREKELIELYKDDKTHFFSFVQLDGIYMLDCLLFYNDLDERMKKVQDFRDEINNLKDFKTERAKINQSITSNGSVENINFWNKFYEIPHKDITDDYWNNSRDYLHKRAKILAKIYRDTEGESYYDDVKFYFETELKLKTILNQSNDELNNLLRNEFNCMLAKAERRKSTSFIDKKESVQLNMIKENLDNYLEKRKNYLLKKYRNSAIPLELKDELKGFYNFDVNFFVEDDNLKKEYKENFEEKIEEVYLSRVSKSEQDDESCTPILTDNNFSCM